MSRSRPLSVMSPEDYLRCEESSVDARHEFVDGSVYAMTGSTRKHNLISLNVYALLREYLRNSSCHIFVSDVKVRCEASNSFYYPDVVVACDRKSLESTYTSEPSIIVEVLSRSTAKIDRDEKLKAYLQIDTLNYYIMIQQNKAIVHIFSRGEQIRWTDRRIGSGESFELTVGDCRNFVICVDDIYNEATDSGDVGKSVREEPESYLATDAEGEQDDGDW